MLPETIGEDQEQLYHELGLIIQTLARQQMQPLDDRITAISHDVEAANGIL